MIYLISSCTNSKKIEPNLLLNIKNFSTISSLESLLEIWQENKKSFLHDSLFMAKNLYKGVTWSATLATYSSLSSLYEVKHFVASAGYGLISTEQKIASYDATFTPNTPNSISQFSIQDSLNPNTFWWDSINNISADNFEKDSIFFIVLPYYYLIACQNFIHDLLDLFEKNVFIFTIHTHKIPVFMKENLVRFDTRFNSFEAGTLSSLLQRSVKWLADKIVSENLELNHFILQSYIDYQLSRYEKHYISTRKKLDDTSIKEHIIRMIVQDQTISPSKALRQFRNDGYACEQKKFHNLFKICKGE